MVNDQVVNSKEQTSMIMKARAYEEITRRMAPGTEAFRNLSADKQEKIFQAAVSEFADKGYAKASMNCLVKSAGISKGSLFHYFRTKRDLFNVVVDMALGQVTDYLRQVREGTSTLPLCDRLEILLKAGFAFIDSYPDLAKVYFFVLQSEGAAFGAERLIAIRQLGCDYLAEMISQARERGEIKPDTNIPRVAFLMNAVFERLLRSYYLEHLDSGMGLYQAHQDSRGQWIRTTLDLIFHGIALTADSRAAGE